MKNGRNFNLKTIYVECANVLRYDPEDILLYKLLECIILFPFAITVKDN